LSGRVERRSEMVRKLQTLFVGVATFLAAVESVAVEARKNMQVIVPNVLVAGWPVVLAGRDTLAPKSSLHGLRQTARDAENIGAECVGYVEDIFVVASWCNQAVAFDGSVLVQRNEGKNLRLLQDDSRFRWWSWQRHRQSAERTIVVGWSVLHGAPNDPKLSDCRARRAGCGKVAGWSVAASVTHGAVRSSA